MKALGTMDALADHVGLSVRTLYRLRAAGVFHPARRWGRVIEYALVDCKRAIEKHYRRGLR